MLIRRWLQSGKSALAQAASDIGLQLTPAHHQHVVHEQLRMVLLHTRVGTLAASVFAVLLALHLLQSPGDSITDAQVQAWLGLKLGLAAARIALAQVYARVGAASARWPRWQAAMLALLVIDGALWGLAGWRLTGKAVPLAALGVAVADGVACVATFGLQVRLAATAAYVLPILLPVALGLLWRGDEIALFASAGQLILALLTVFTARATSRRLTAALLLRLQSDDLVAQKDAALRQVQAQSAERDRFLAKVSHELRTPLHGMLGLTRLLHGQVHEPTLRHRLTLIESSGTHLLGLINDLLDVSQINAGRFALHARPFDLAAQLDAVADVFALRAADKHLAFEHHSRLPRPCWVLGDAARLQQVLNNLLGNAVKFTQAGQIELHAGLGKTPGQVCISVQDSGDGIGPQEQQRIFQPFHQADTSSGDRPTDGVGLGLTIAREIAIAMGGDISVHSSPGQGSSFAVSVHLPAVPAPLAPTPAAELAGRLPSLVLVAEDDEVNALIVRAFLDCLGVRSERVADGQQAVDQALRSTDRPDLVLMDCRMPVLDGLAATTLIRQRESAQGLRRLPILALTATTGDADRAACLQAGMDQVIAKPFTLLQLTQALRGAGLAQAPAAPG